MGRRKIRVWIADCHSLTGAGLKALLESDAGIGVQGCSGDRQCSGDYHHCKPDVAIMDMTLKGKCCLDAMRHILAHDSDARILVISSQVDGITATRVMDMGARGYLSLESTPEMLIEAVKTVARDGIYIEPDLARQLARDHTGASVNPFDKLTGREFEVFLLLVGGQTVNDISASMNLSRSTVANHHTRIIKKLGVGNHVELARLALRHGIIEV